MLVSVDFVFSFIARLLWHSKQERQLREKDKEVSGSWDTDKNVGFLFFSIVSD